MLSLSTIRMLLLCLICSIKPLYHVVVYKGRTPKRKINNSEPVNLNGNNPTIFPYQSPSTRPTALCTTLNARGEPRGWGIFDPFYVKKGRTSGWQIQPDPGVIFGFPPSVRVGGGGWGWSFRTIGARRPTPSLTWFAQKAANLVRRVCREVFRVC